MRHHTRYFEEKKLIKMRIPQEVKGEGPTEKFLYTRYFIFCNITSAFIFYYQNHCICPEFLCKFWSKYPNSVDQIR